MYQVMWMNDRISSNTDQFYNYFIKHKILFSQKESWEDNFSVFILYLVIFITLKLINCDWPYFIIAIEILVM